jgi:uncharacterized protein DUF4397
MPRWLQVLPLALALAALTLLASCSSSGQAKVRFVHAIQDAGALDIDVYGTNDGAGTIEFSDISFLGVLPAQPGYTTLDSGSNAIEGFLTGTTTVGFIRTNVNWSGGIEYTAVATGFSKTGTPAGSNVQILSVPDNNTAPASGDVEFRVIHASPSGPSGVNVYIESNPSTGPTGTPAISNLIYTQASSYISVAYNPKNVTPAPGFTLYVTTTAGTVIFGEAINPAEGAIRTLILTDIQNTKLQGVSAMQPSFLELPDLN